MIRIAFAAAAITLVAAPFTALAQQGPTGGPGQAGPFTLAEMQASSDARFTALDLDHDGVLSAAEASPPAAMGNMRGAGRSMERADANRDGAITLEEYHAMTATRFARLDANHDGTVTTDELQAMRGMRPGGQGRRGDGPGGGMDMGPQGDGMPGEMQAPDGA